MLPTNSRKSLDSRAQTTCRKIHRGAWEPGRWATFSDLLKHYSSMGDSCRCRGGLPYDRVRVRVNSVMVRVCVMFSISII